MKMARNENWYAVSGIQSKQGVEAREKDWGEFLQASKERRQLAHSPSEIHRQ